VYAKGDVFHGEWANGVKNGQGQLTYKNGDLFHGAWVDDHANGHGTLQYHNGCKYEGEWKDDRRHGYGIFTDPKTQYKYEGEWHNSRGMVKVPCTYPMATHLPVPGLLDVVLL
jgi:hypothetical protein